ncbi:extracellular matrix regulator RemB [Alicyclobacillus herbarius]|uniref:extracellular matrix regulator RemB n=1 Tax=Alicyclobacillus herbarius TaxID=122960 RepID=UPI002352566E|nr:extracellular matrix/biofilm biosynthesis regulator RemA family protein [Alicyclobacillus herbarius]
MLLSMFLHIGDDTMVRLRDVIGIFNAQSPDLRNSISAVSLATDEAATGEVKSCIVTADAVYFSPISSLTLKKRAGQLDGGDSFAGTDV